MTFSRKWPFFNIFLLFFFQKYTICIAKKKEKSENYLQLVGTVFIGGGKRCVHTYVRVFQVRSPFPLDVSSRGGVQDDVTALRRGLHQEAHQDLGGKI